MLFSNVTDSRWSDHIRLHQILSQSWKYKDWCRLGCWMEHAGGRTHDAHSFSVNSLEYTCAIFIYFYMHSLVLQRQEKFRKAIQYMFCIQVIRSMVISWAKSDLFSLVEKKCRKPPEPSGYLFIHLFILLCFSVKVQCIALNNWLSFGIFPSVRPGHASQINLPSSSYVHTHTKYPQAAEPKSHNCQTSIFTFVLQLVLAIYLH